MAAVFFLLSLLVLSANGISDEADLYLLPGDIIPIHYDLRLNTYIERFSEESYEYDGNVRIVMVPVEENVTTIVININGLNVTSTVLTVKGSAPIDLGKGNMNTAAQKLTFQLSRPLIVNETAMLNLTFIGRHGSQKVGFYRTAFSENGKTKNILNTQFQPAYARSAFPCFDEPKYKATYKIAVSISNKMASLGYKVLSNTAEERIEEMNGRRVYHFKKTPLPISSYLIAILVSDYKSSPPEYFSSSYPETGGKEFRTWGRETYIGQAKLAQASGVALMDIYTKDYAIPYGFDKVDQAAVADFPAGMENWGLIFYWEAILMTAEDSKQSTVTLIAHELAHQWFGNLVTCHNWSDIWLNEGFATYIEYFGTDKLKIPEVNGNSWELPYQFVVTVQQKCAFQLDIPGITHPLTFDVFDPEEILYYFDLIAYHKGASVIRMWSHTLGLNAFNEAVRLYLRTNKGSVSTPEALLSSFDAFANESASKFPELPSKIFRCWHIQEGYPIVHVKRAPGPHPVYALTQEVYRFRNNSNGPHNSTWNIPITYSTSEDIRFNDTRPTHWLRQNEDSSITLDKFVDWIVVNNQQSGYYRVNYSPSNWKALLSTLLENATVIHEINRAQIIDDAANLARSTAFDYVSYEFFMDLTNYLKFEESYYPWKAALNNFEYLSAMLSKDDEAYDLFRMHVLEIIRNTYDRLSTASRPEDTFQDKLLRSEIISWACRMGYGQCLCNSRALLENHLSNETTMPEYLITTLYCSAVRHNDYLWNKVMEFLLKSENVSEKSIFINGLTCTKNRGSLTVLLKHSIDSEASMEMGERLMIFTLILDRNPENINIVLDFVAVNYKKMHELYGGANVFDDILTKVSKNLGSDEEVSKMRSLIKEMGDSNVMSRDESIWKILETIETNNEWINVRMKDVLRWLASRYR
ncbi:UNVERIFIED_CONTAM: hypothetical protein PYX00_008543 [Menopon gallinae]|uniref:Aminopeptidase n=1 Tax=Menopon gallinae TaxID=328185 RepID=A0AAW2HNP9_9NEOP